MRSYKPQLVLCKMKTGNRSIKETIEEEFNGHASIQEAILTKMFNDQINGLELVLSLWNTDNYEYYHLWSWNKEDEEKIIRAFYFIENLYCEMYDGKFEMFRENWKKGPYEPDGAIVFEKKYVEEIKVLSKEEKID